MVSRRRALVALSLVGLGIAPTQVMGTGAAHAAADGVVHRKVGTPPLSAIPASHHKVGYTIDTVPIAGQSRAVDINDAGQLLFHSVKGPAVMTGRAVSVLSAPGFYEPDGWAIDNSGAVYGDGYKGTVPDPYSIQYLRWSNAKSLPVRVCPTCQSGQYLLGALVSPNGTEVLTFHFNMDSEAQTAVGDLKIPMSTEYPILWYSGISDTGTIVGSGFYPQTDSNPVARSTAYMSTNGVFTPIAGPAPEAISPNGKYIVSTTMWDGTKPVQLVEWDARGKMKVLAQNIGEFTAIAVNNSGVILGDHSVWKDGVFIDLNKLVKLPKGKTICSATAINASGQIAAQVCDKDASQAVRLTPTSLRQFG